MVIPWCFYCGELIGDRCDGDCERKRLLTMVAHGLFGRRKEDENGSRGV